MRILRYLLLFVMLCAGGCVAAEFEDWNYDGDFHRLIAQADRIAIRNGGYDCCGPVDGQTILVTIANQQEIAMLNAMIQFEKHQTRKRCMCCGYPGIDWYRGKNRIALTALHHGQTIRWKHFPGDAQLTPVSSQMLVDWLARHGIRRPKEEVETQKRRASVEGEARDILRNFVPKAFLDAIQKVADEVKRTEPPDLVSAIDIENGLRDKYVRASFGDKGQMYKCLFRVLGCLPMHWDSRYAPEQDEAYEFLMRAPREELDLAFRAAATSEDQQERQGAARVIYSQQFMTVHGKTEQDVEKWMEILADAAFEDPFPENRRLVLYRLVEHPSVQARHVLEQGVEDSDQTARRYAIEALSLRRNPESKIVLSKVAKGLTRPRSAHDLPKDYGFGTGVSYYTAGMDSKEFQDTDEEAANSLLPSPN